jgi:hypothetical protein
VQAPPQLQRRIGLQVVPRAWHCLQRLSLSNETLGAPRCVRLPYEAGTAGDRSVPSCAMTRHHTIWHSAVSRIESGNRQLRILERGSPGFPHAARTRIGLGFAVGLPPPPVCVCFRTPVGSCRLPYCVIRQGAAARFWLPADQRAFSMPPLQLGFQSLQFCLCLTACG